MLIVLGGLPGVGKTTIARALVHATAASHVRIDSIEQALRRAGLKVESEGYAVAHAIAEDNVKLGRTVVADCVNPWPVTRSEWREVGQSAGVRVVEVEVICSDAKEHRRRIESRSADIEGHELPTWSEVVGRDYRPWDGDRLVIDTSKMSIDDCVRAILAVASG